MMKFRKHHSVTSIYYIILKTMYNKYATLELFTCTAHPNKCVYVCELASVYVYIKTVIKKNVY